MKYSPNNIITNLKNKKQAKRDLHAKLENLGNDGMIDLMHHQFTRFQEVSIYINENALWQRWIRR